MKENSPNMANSSFVRITIYAHGNENANILQFGEFSQKNCC